MQFIQYSNVLGGEEMLATLRQLRSSKRLLSTWADTFDKYLMGAEPVVKDQHSKLLAKRGLIYNVESMFNFILHIQCFIQLSDCLKFVAG
jgi:hypothetical protein